MLAQPVKAGYLVRPSQPSFRTKRPGFFLRTVFVRRVAKRGISPPPHRLRARVPRPRFLRVGVFLRALCRSQIRGAMFSARRRKAPFAALLPRKLPWHRAEGRACG